MIIRQFLDQTYRKVFINRKTKSKKQKSFIKINYEFSNQLIS